jgi:hypothetical protein
MLVAMERIESPNTKASDSVPECVFKLDNMVEVLYPCTLASEHIVLQLGTQSIDMNIDMAMVERTIKHVVLYVDKRANNVSCPRCTSCGLPCHSIDQCRLLVNYCLAQDFSQQHPKIVRKIKVLYKMFPRSTRGHPSRSSMVKQLVSALDLGSYKASDDALPVSDTID